MSGSTNLMYMLVAIVQLLLSIFMSGGGRGRELRHQAHRRGELFELEVGTEERHRTVSARLAGDVEYVDARLAQRVLRLQLLAGVVGTENVAGQPAVEILGEGLLGLEAADLVAADDLEVMRETRRRQHVRQPRRDARVRVRRVGVVQLRFLGRLSAEERRVVGALAMAERHEAERVELFLAAVGDG